MVKKVLLSIIVVAVLIGGIYYLYQKNEAKAPAQVPVSDQRANQSTSVQPSQVEPPVTPPSQSQATPSTSTASEQQTDGNDMQVVEVDFNGSQFTPAVTNIKVGDYVFFKNKSNENFWPASNPHPTHTDYPGFDALKPIAPGGEYKFQFTKAGTWGYHDHLDPNITGTINVTQ